MVERSGSHMTRVLRLWGIYGRMDLLWVMRDPGTIAVYVLSDLVWGVATVSGTLLLAARFGAIGHWSARELVFMLGYALLATGFPQIFFNYNVAFISRRIGRGQFDHTLLQPQPIWITLLTEGFSPFSAAMELVPGVLLLGWALTHHIHPVSVSWLAMLALNLLASTTIGLSFSYLWGSLAFWAPRAAEEINSSTWKLLAGLRQFPLDGAGAGLSVLLLSVLPSGFIAWYPVRAVLDLDGYRLAWLVTPGAAVLFAALTTWVFLRGLVHYGRTGSSRYLDFGHRR